jgi:hypothetical protein
MRDQLLKASRLHYAAHIEKHRVNLEVLLANPQSLPDHTDIMDAIEKEVAIIAEYMDKLEVIARYFKDAPKPESQV